MNTVHPIDFFNPGIKGDSFWDKVVLFMQAAAEDLNIDLHVHYAGYDRILPVNQLREVLSSSGKTNGVVFQSLKKNGLLLIKLAEQYKTPAILFNAGLEEKTISIIGSPRELYKFWIGELLPDDENTGCIYDHMRNPDSIFQSFVFSNRFSKLIQISIFHLDPQFGDV